MKNSVHKWRSIGAIYLFLISFMGLSLQAFSISVTKKSYVVETNRVWLDVTDSNGAFSQTLMGYRTGATDGYDHGLDGAYMNDGVVALNSLIGDVRYAIQFKGLPFVATDVVALSFNAVYSGSFTLSIDHCDGFFQNTNFGVYIHDTVTDTYTNLKNGGYTFNSDIGLFNSRFQLAYTALEGNLAVADVSDPSDSLLVYPSASSLVIQFSNGTAVQNIALYTLTGVLLSKQEGHSATVIMVEGLHMHQQPLIVKGITTTGRTFVKKCWIP
jgi:hypothetical protein